MEAQSAENADVRVVDERVQVIKGAIQDAVMWAHGRCINDAEFAAVNAEYGPAFDALNSLAADVRQLRKVAVAARTLSEADTWWLDGYGQDCMDALVAALDAAASNTGTGAQAAPPEARSDG